MVLSKRKKFPVIRYTNRDFESIKKDLSEYRNRYYPTISRDENEASFDEMMLDTVAYVGDILSFYLDYSVNESFLDTAVEYDNVLRHGKLFGYKFRGNPTASGMITFYVIVPANAAGTGPNLDYVPILKKDTELSSLGGKSFILNEDVDFSKSTNEVVVARVDTTTGTPTHFAIKAFGMAISGKIKEEIIQIGDYKKFLKIKLSGRNISEIVSVVDDEGNEYFEVDYLSQDIVYKSVINKSSDSDSVTNSLRPFVVPRRFTTERDKDDIYLQFGYGSDKDNVSDPLIDPSTVLIDVHGKSYVTDVTFDPANILGTDKFGIAPSNTKLRILYRENTADNANTYANSVVNVDRREFEFKDINSLNTTDVTKVIQSLECVNEKAIIGDATLPTVTELKFRIYDRFSSQNRAVTLQDYKSLVYSMPPKFGAIKRVNVTQDPDSFKRNLNMYIISEDPDGNFIQSTPTLKENLKIWLNQGKMINDTIDILDAKIINLGIDFILIGDSNMNKYEVLNNALEQLRLNYSKKTDIGEPFSITEAYSILNNSRGVVDTIKVKVYQKTGTNYSDTPYVIDELFSVDGRNVNAPENVIFEIKFPDQDIKGTIR